MRSAIYQAATGESRRRAHRALAEALAGSGDPDRQTWHRAAAADGPDDELVAALELVGSRAQRRGGHAAALAAYERAASLATDPAPRARLLLAGARSAWASGQAVRAQTLLAAARDSATDPTLLWDIARLRGHIEVNIGSAVEAHRIFVDAAVAAHQVDPVRALDNAVAAALIRTYGADSGTPLPMADDLATPTAGDAAQTLCLKQLLTTMTHVAEGSWSAAAESLDLALRTGEQVDDRDVLWNLGNAALQLGDDDAQQRFYGYALARAREAGAITAVIYCLQRLCFSSYLAGDLVAVRSTAEEAIALAEGIGQPALTALPMGCLTLLAAIQGRDDYDALLGRLEGLATTYPLGILTDPVHDLTRWAKGARAASEGDNVGALHHLSRFRLPVFARMSAPERIESAVRADEIDLARGFAEELAPFAEATGRPWALATVAFGRALTADPDERGVLVPGGAVAACAGPSPPGRRPHRAGLRRVAAPQPAPRRRPPAPAPGPGDVPGRACRSARRPGEPGAARLGRDRAQARPLHVGEADADGAQDRPAGELRPVEQGRRRAVLDLAADRGLPPAQRLRQGRRHLARRARPARAGLTGTHPCTSRPSDRGDQRPSRPRSTAVLHHLTARARPP